MILALDTATTTGWAAGEPGGPPEFGSRRFEADNNAEIFAQFRFWLNALAFRFKPKLIVFEAPYIPVPHQPRFQKAGTAWSPGRGPPPMNAKTIRRLVGLVALVECCASELRIECLEATTGEISKFFTGRFRHGGREAKKAATVEMCRLYGWNVGNDDNAADALALWAMAEAKIDPVAGMRRGGGKLFLPPAPAAEPRPKRPAREAQSKLF